jgi:hypothetical protein
MIASSINKGGIPQYPAHFGGQRKDFHPPEFPGMTEAQRRIGDKTKDAQGNSLIDAIKGFKK